MNLKKALTKAAYCVYVKSILHRWIYVQQTMLNIANLFEHLEEAICHTFIPARVGQKISQVERKIYSLPVKLGGFAFKNPSLT